MANKFCKFNLLQIVSFVLCALASLAGNVAAQPISKNVFNAQSGQDQTINIQSLQAELDNKQHTAKYTGKVVVKRGVATLTCDQLLAWLDPNTQRVDKLQAESNVRLVTPQYVITAQKAEYFEQEQKIVLTENPVCTYGQNSINSHRMVYLLNEDRILFDNAVMEFHPNDFKKQDNKPKDAAKDKAP